MNHYWSLVRPVVVHLPSSYGGGHALGWKLGGAQEKFDGFTGGVLCNSNVCTTFAPVLKTLPRTKVVSQTRENDSVAQLVEQVTLNHWVVSSSLTGVTKRAGTTSQ